MSKQTNEHTVESVDACDWLENLEGDAWADACEEIAAAMAEQQKRQIAPAQRVAEVARGFIQSQVVITPLGQESFHLPPVVGRGFADHIAAMVRADFPSASISIQESCHNCLTGLEDALRVSDEVHAVMVEFQQQPRPGTALVEHFKAAARIGGAQ